MLRSMEPAVPLPETLHQAQGQAVRVPELRLLVTSTRL
jgi:hypothetical protein